MDQAIVVRHKVLVEKRSVRSVATEHDLSAEEVRAALSVATGWGYVTDDSVAHALEFFDRELALLWGLTRRKS